MLKSYGWWWGGVVVAHEILVSSAKAPFGFFGFGAKGLGPGLDNSVRIPSCGQLFFGIF